MKHEDLINSARDYALNCLSYRPRTEKEIIKKMNQKGYSDEVISSVLAFLKEYQFLDDAAFARMWIRNRQSCKPSGKRRIYNELMEKGVDRDIIRDHLSEITSESECQMIRQLVEKKISRTRYTNKKLEGFLIRRGFSPSDVWKVLAEMTDQGLLEG